MHFFSRLNLLIQNERFKKMKNTTTVIIIDIEELHKMKNKKTEKTDIENDLWNGIHYGRRICSVASYSHVMMFFFLIHCIENDVEILESNHNLELLAAFHFGQNYSQ